MIPLEPAHSVLIMLTAIYYLLQAALVVFVYGLLGIALWSISPWVFVLGSLALGVAVWYQFRSDYKRAQILKAAGLPPTRR